MRTELEIRKARESMRRAVTESDPGEDNVELAFAAGGCTGSFAALSWVLGETSEFEELLRQFDQFDREDVEGN